MNVLDRYRPESFEEVFGQPTDEIQEQINGTATPNFLFHGPPGTGKTSTAYLVAEELCSKDSMIYFDEGDKRGAKFIGNEVREMGKYKVMSNGNGATRTIIFDDVDYMDEKSFAALRGVLMNSPAVFVLICNEVHRIDDAIRSRLQEYKFASLDPGAIQARLKQIADENNIDIPYNESRRIAERAEGDMRNALNEFVKKHPKIVSPKNIS